MKFGLILAVLIYPSVFYASNINKNELKNQNKSSSQSAKSFENQTVDFFSDIIVNTNDNDENVLSEIHGYWGCFAPKNVFKKVEIKDVASDIRGFYFCAKGIKGLVFNKQLEPLDIDGLLNERPLNFEYLKKPFSEKKSKEIKYKGKSYFLEFKNIRLRTYFDPIESGAPVESFKKVDQKKDSPFFREEDYVACEIYLSDGTRNGYIGRFENAREPEIKWIGDINNDNIPDLFFQTKDSSGASDHLLISDPKSDLLFLEVATRKYSIGC